MKNKKISIIMPTYNDSDSITETFDSLICQSYDNWELAIVNDGSSDNSEEVIKKYINKHNLKDKFTYIYQENTDQLKALINAFSHTTGDYIYILHSDDLLANENVLENMMNNFPDDCDAITADLLLIDEKSNLIGRQNVRNYVKDKHLKPLQLLWLGRNLFVDFACFKRSIFEHEVYENYLTWNTPYWLCAFEKDKLLNVKKVDFEFIRYRVFEGNYINNEIGKLNVLNGELRVVCQLMKYYNIPNYKFQYILFRALNKIKILYKPIFQNKETISKYKVVKFVIEKRYDNYENNLYLNGLINFYKNINNRTINFDKIYNDEKIYLGNEMRVFNKQLVNHTLPSVYYNIFDEMSKGFDKIIVSNENYEKAVNIAKFLCVFPFVKIEVEEGK